MQDNQALLEALTMYVNYGHMPLGIRMQVDHPIVESFVNFANLVQQTFGKITPDNEQQILDLIEKTGYKLFPD